MYIQITLFEMKSFQLTVENVKAQPNKLSSQHRL